MKICMEYDFVLLEMEGSSNVRLSLRGLVDRAAAPGSSLVGLRAGMLPRLGLDGWMGSWRCSSISMT